MDNPFLLVWHAIYSSPKLLFLAIVGCIYLLRASCNVTSQTNYATHDTSILETIRIENSLPSLGVAKLSNGSFESNVVGFRKQNDTTLVQVTDKFHLGSDTKAMTATLFAILIERGFFQWNDTLLNTLPRDIVKTLHAEHYDTTLEMLTLHISGIEDIDPFYPHPLPKNISISPEHGRHIWTKEVLSKPPITTPGTEFFYLNAGYVILGHILESRMRTNWESLITTTLLQPLGMEQCIFGTLPEPSNTSIETPWPHSPSKYGPMPMNPGSLYSDCPPAIGPAGTIRCSLESWSKFIQFHLDGHRSHTPLANTLTLKNSTFTKLHTPSSNLSSYTPGAWTSFTNTERPWAKGPSLAHAGSNLMNYALAWLDLDANEAYLTVTNVGEEGAANATNEATIQMIKGNVLP